MIKVSSVSKQLYLRSSTFFFHKFFFNETSNLVASCKYIGSFRSL
jgi:hypothetical protein